MVLADVSNEDELENLEHKDSNEMAEMPLTCGEIARIFGGKETNIRLFEFRAYGTVGMIAFGSLFEVLYAVHQPQGKSQHGDRSCLVRGGKRDRNVCEERCHTQQALPPRGTHQTIGEEPNVSW